MTDGPRPAPPPPGAILEVAPGVLRTCLPLPGPPSNVNAWLLEDAEGWLLVDTGLDTPELRELWTGILAHPALGGRPVARVLVTHFHPDHVGLAGWICGRFGAPLLMPRSEWLKAWVLLADDEAALLEHFLDFHRGLGATPEQAEVLRARGFGFRRHVSPLPRHVLAIAEGQVLRIGGQDWQVLIGAGHAPEMACLWRPADGVLISADHILPRISPHVGVMATEPEGNPLGIFLEALVRFRGLPAGALVLPSHGEPFRGLHRRIDALLAHHAERLDVLRSAAAAEPDGLTAYGTLGAMFGREMGPSQLGAAVAEALAHLSHLVARGELRRRRNAQGITRFHPAMPSAATPPA